MSYLACCAWCSGVRFSGRLKNIGYRIFQILNYTPDNVYCYVTVIFNIASFSPNTFSLIFCVQKKEIKHIIATNITSQISLQPILYFTVPFLFLFFKIKDGTLDHWICLPYSVFVMVWACLTLSLWGQKASTLAYRWSMLDFEVRACTYPYYKSSLRIQIHSFLDFSLHSNF